jgi:hypothetical protein
MRKRTILLPEIQPGKFLYRSSRWAKYGYLIDRRAKNRLTKFSRSYAVWALVIILAIHLVIDIGIPLYTGNEVVSHSGAIILSGMGLALVPYLFLCNRFVRSGERVELAKRDPKVLRAPLLDFESVLRKLLWRWAFWLLVTGALVVLFRLFSQ